MTIRERVLASRLIEKIESHRSYAMQIGLNFHIVAIGTCGAVVKTVKSKEKTDL